MTIKDQPPPVHNDKPAVWDLVIHDLRNNHDAIKSALSRDLRGLLIDDAAERNAVGTERYGTPLQAHNGRDALVDAYQEALDLMVYLRQAIEEGAPVRSAYLHAIHCAASVRMSLRDRDRWTK